MKVIVVKKRYMLALLILVILGILISLIIRSSRSLTVSCLPISNKIITIDPGHGGVDPGKVGKKGVKEDEINLKIGLRLKRLIEQSGGIVIMTREKNVGLYSDKAKTLKEMKTEDLHKRKEIADVSKSEMFISIHANSFIRPEYYGAQTFYNEESEEGRQLALCIQKELKNILDKDNTRQPHERNDVFVLKAIEGPSVLVECGFLSNPREEELLKDEIYQEKIAWSIYIGIINYFGQMEDSPF